MKDAFYFSHDANAHNDPKILALRSVYGLEGYGRYWVLIEMMRDQADFRIMITKYVWNAIAMQLQCSAQEAEHFVQDCIEEFKLFLTDGESFWSDSLCRRMTEKEVKREKAKKAAETRWHKEKADPENAKSCEADADALQTHNDSNAIKERKGKENKDNNIVIITPAREFTENDLSEVVNAYQSEIGLITPTISEFLQEDLSHYPTAWVVNAIKIASSDGVRKYRYIATILRNWFTDGYSPDHKPWEKQKDEKKGENRYGTHRKCTGEVPPKTRTGPSQNASRYRQAGEG